MPAFNQEFTQELVKILKGMESDGWISLDKPITTEAIADRILAEIFCLPYHIVIKFIRSL